MGKALPFLITAAGVVATVATAGAIAPALSGFIVGLGGGTFAAAGVALTVAPILALGIAGVAVSTVIGALGIGPSAPKPDTTSTSIKMARPPRVSAYGESLLYGAYIFYKTSAGGLAADVFAIHDGLIDGVLRVYLGDDQVGTGAGVVSGLADGSYSGGHVEIGIRLGYPTETVLGSINAHFPEWTTDHRGDGVCTASVTWEPVKSTKYLEIYPKGQPALALVARWQLCPDPRVADWENPATWTWTENVIRHLLHYRIVREGIDIASKITPTLDYWKDAADDCDVPMDLKAGGTEPRYRSCVAHKHTDSHQTVITALLECCDGWMSPRADGAIMIFSGRYVAPDPGDLIGPDEIVNYQWTTGVADEDAVNELTITYTSKDHDYASVDGEAWTDEDDITARGKVASQSLDLQVPSFPQARRIAKRKMSRVNALYRGTVTTNVAGRKIRGKRFIPLRIEEAGSTFYDGPAEITALTRNLATGGVTFSWVAADPDIDDWDPDAEEGEGAPLKDATPRDPLASPAITTATPTYSENSAAGTPGVVLDLDVAAPNRADLTWFVRTKPTSGTIWQTAEYPDIDPGSGVEIITDFVPVDSSVDVQVAYQVGDGRLSPYSATSTVNTSTAGLAPAPTTDTSAVGGAGQITVDWRNPGSPNYSYTRVYYGTTNVFGSATALTPDDAAGTLAFRSVTYAGIAAGNYYVWTRAYSSAGVPAAPDQAPGTVTVT